MNLIKPFTSRLPSTAFNQYVSGHKDTIKSFLIVRHPFHRLVSAFRDKIERQHGPRLDKDWYYKTYGRKIVAKYRPAATKRFGAAYFSADNGYGAPAEVHGQRSERLPIFWEFVQFVRAQRVAGMDEHWRPAFSFCSACTVAYDNVVRFESMREEGDMLKRLLEPGRQFEERVVNPNIPDGLSNEELTAKYFEQLTDEDVNHLYKIYEYDFRLFGYTYEHNGKRYPLN